MGAYPEEEKPFQVPVIIPINGKADCWKDTKERIFPVLSKHKAVCVLFGVLVVVLLLLVLNIGLTAGLITVSNLDTKNKNSAVCEGDWIWSRGKCYYFSTEEATWDDSQNFCISQGASLALIDNRQELDFLFRFKGSYNRWIGLRRTDDNKAWTWTNGTLYDESLFNITRSSDESIEYVYLNHIDVKSETGTINLRWICKKGT